MNSKIKLVGSTLGAVALLAPAAAAALPLEAQATDSPAAVVSVEQAAAIPGVSSVQGVFTYDQDAVVSTRAIAEVFHRAAAALCTGLPQYEVDGQGGRRLCEVSGRGLFGYRARYDRGRGCFLPPYRLLVRIERPWRRCCHER